MYWEGALSTRRAWLVVWGAVALSGCAWIQATLSPLTPGPPPRAVGGEGVDSYGDPLPVRALARLGTERLASPGPVEALRFVPGGERFVSAHKGELAIWSARTGQRLALMRGYTLEGPPVISSDGARVAVGTPDGVHLFNTDGALLPPLSQGQRPATAPTFSPKGQALAAGGHDLRVRVWKVDTGELVHDMPGHAAPITALAYAPDSETLASAAADGEVRLWQAKAGKPLSQFRIFSERVEALAYAPDLSALVASNGQEVRVVEPSSGRLLRTIKPVGPRALDVRFVPGEDHLLMISDEAAVSFWDVETGQRVRKLSGRGRVDLSDDGRVMVSVEGSCLRLSVLETDEELLWLNRHTGPVREASFINGGVVAVTQGQDGSVRLWDTATGGQIRKLDGVTAASRDGRWLARAAAGGKLGVVDAATALPRWSGADAGGRLERLGFSPDGALLVGVVEGGLRIWKADSGQLAVRLSVSPTPQAVAFTPDSKRVLLAEGGAIRLHSVVNGDQVGAFEGGDSPISALALSERGDLMASVSGQREVRLWDLGQGEPLEALKSGVEAVAVAFSAEGERLGVGASDGSFELWHLPTRTLQARFKPHRGPVTAVAFSGGGVMTAGQDGAAMIWDMAALQPRRFFEEPQAAKEDPSAAGADPASPTTDPPASALPAPGSGGNGLPPGAVARLGSANLHHDASLTRIVQSPDWRWLATADDAGVARLWDADTGEMHAELEGHRGPLIRLTFSPDSKLLAGVDGGPQVFIWSALDGALQGTIDALDAGALAVAFDADAQRVALGGRGGQILVFDMARKTIVKDLKVHTGDVTDLAFSLVRDRLASSSMDGTVILWDLHKEAPMLRYQISDAGALSVAFSPHTRKLVSGGADGVVKAFSVVTGERLGQLKAYGAVSELRFAPGPKAERELLATAGVGFVSLWDLNALLEVRTLPLPEVPATSAAFKPDGTVLMTAAAGHAVRFWDTASVQEMLVGGGHHRPITAIARARDGATLATGSEDQTLILWDTRTHQVRAVLRGHQGTILDLAFSPDGAALASASADGTVRTWDVKKGAALLTLKGHQGPVEGLGFSPDGRTLVSAGQDGSVFIWNVATGLQLGHLGGDRRTITAMALSQSGQTILYGDPEGLIHTWSSVSYKPISVLRGHIHPITEIVVAPASNLMASADASGLIHIWRLDQGRIVTSFEAQDTRALVFAPDSQRLATLGGDLIHIWDIQTGQELIQVSGYRGQATDVIFSGDGKRLFSATTDTTVIVWDLGKAIRFDDFQRAHPPSSPAAPKPDAPSP